MLESLIATLSPGWALRRMHDRATLDFAREFSGRYEGSTQSRMSKWWPRQLGITGQTTQDRYELRSMRDRSRNLDRNNPVANGMLNRLADNVVGEGMTLQCKAKDAQAFNEEVDEKFIEFLDDADVRGMLSGDELLRMLHRGHERDGDGGMILVSRGGVPKLQLIEADQIYQPDGQALTPTFVEGVEMDRGGKPIRFHVLDSPQGGVRKFTPIPAANFIFYPRFKKYGNNIVRGEPCFASNYEKFDQADGYFDAVVIAARMAAIFGLVFKESTGAQQLGALPNMGGGFDYEKAFTLENGQVKFIGRHDDMVQVKAGQPLAQTPEFIAVIMRFLGLPLDMPLELVLLDFSRVNFSSARASFLQFYRAMIPKQRFFRVRVMSRIYRWWLDGMIRREEFVSPVPPDFYRHHFMPSGWQWVNPVQEAQAAMLEVAMGVNSPQRIAARLNRNYDQILAEIKADAKARQLAGLPVNVTMATREAIVKVLGDPNAPDPQDEDKPEEEQDQ